MKTLNLFVTVLAMMLLLSGNSQATASSHDDGNPNTFTLESVNEMNTVDLVEKVIPTVVYIYMEKNPTAGTEGFGGLMP